MAIYGIYTGHAGIDQLTELSGIQAADWRSTDEFPAITEDSGSAPGLAALGPLPVTGPGSGTGLVTAPLPDAGRDPRIASPPLCEGTPGSGDAQRRARRLGALIGALIRAGELGTAASLIDGLAEHSSPGHEDDVYETLISTAAERAAGGK